MKRTYIIFIMLFSLGVFEILLRAFGINDTYLESVGKSYNTYWGQKIDSWYWTHGPNSTTIERNIDFTYESRYNSLGLRELEPAQIFNDSTLRIIVLGDSYTEGLGVIYDSSFVRHLERLLRAQQIPVSFFNAGNAGVDPIFAFSLLRDKLAGFQPDIVIITINPSDYTDLIFRGGFERFQPDSTTVFKPAPWFEPLYHYCYVFRFVLHDILRYVQGDLFMKEKEFMQECLKINTRLVAVADSFHALAVKNDFKMLFVIHSGCAELVNHYNKLNKHARQAMQRLTDDLKARGYYAVNIWEPMGRVITAKTQLIYGFEHDGHFSSAGYKLMAQSILDETEKSYPAFWSH